MYVFLQLSERDISNEKSLGDQVFVPKASLWEQPSAWEMPQLQEAWHNIRVLEKNAYVDQSP